MLDEPLKPRWWRSARQQNEAVSVRAARLDPETVVSVSARPVAGGIDGEAYTLVRLERRDRPAPGRRCPRQPGGVRWRRRQSATHRAAPSRSCSPAKNLQTTIEELKTSNEELNATNEELLANEELQSTSEELHSVNEELHTVNAEYQQKISELTRLTDDMDNLLANCRDRHVVRRPGPEDPAFHPGGPAVEGPRSGPRTPVG